MLISRKNFLPVSTPFISIIIRAFNRRRFLEASVNSVLKQTIPRSEYEIIVVKNFEDDQIDAFLKENDVIVLREDGIAGKLINRGLEASKGEVICFLDDDDRFTENKLEFVRSEFQREPKLAYLHNEYIAENEDGKPVDFHHHTIDFCMSSISIRKKYANREIYDSLAFFQDSVTYSMCLDSDGLIMDSEKKLTVYMVHNSTSVIKVDSFDEWVEKNGDMYRKYLQSALYSLGRLKSKRARKYMRAMITDLNMGRFQFEKQIKVNGYINYLRCKDIPLKRRIIQFRSYVFIRLFGKYGRSYVLKKRRLDFERNR